MRLLILISLFYAGLITIAAAQINIDDGIRQPKAMMVAGDSVIDQDNIEQQESTAIDAPNDDAQDLMDPETSAPATNVIDPFQAAPATNQKDIKQVLKKMPVTKSNRSIADDRIDDGYVQEMIDKNFSYNHNLGDIK